MHNRRERNEDFGEASEGLIVFSQTARPTGGRQNDDNLSRVVRLNLFNHLIGFIPCQICL